MFKKATKEAKENEVMKTFHKMQKDIAKFEEVDSFIVLVKYPHEKGYGVYDAECGKRLDIIELFANVETDLLAHASKFKAFMPTPIKTKKKC